jgi:hypothetical protein
MKSFFPKQRGTTETSFFIGPAGAPNIDLDTTEVSTPYSFTFPAGPGTDGYALTWGLTGLEWTAIGSAADSTVPYRIPVGQSFTVNENRQALWAMPIDVEGTLEVNGILVQV